MTTAHQTPMEHVDFGSRDLPVHTVTSSDGTTIAFEVSGSGPPAVIIGGGLNEKAMHAELADGLSASFTVLNYDRRARGNSNDRLAGDYDVLREVEDLAAVLAAAGEPCSVFANCTGGIIAVPAAASGLPIARLAMYEPPYGAPQTPEWYQGRLKKLLALGKRTEAVALFLKWDALFTDDEVEFFKDHPIWPAFEQMAASMVYDSALSVSAAAIPGGELARIGIPTLILAGRESPEWMIENCRSVADFIPDGRLLLMDSAGHLMDDVLGARLLTEFFTSGTG